ncbi:N-acetylmuramoyl-L-alanine amidase family protein [Psychrobacillus sp. FSL K6-1464]|uniref:N-acetylmuramoyl-L-alanine amidase family protein n=1 Tax=Psychrobacillus sp. FSL K6-1464 TaxID=2921545 RepID=UPI0030F5F736
MPIAFDYLIALDDGHGIETAGKRTPVVPELGRPIKENEFNRAVVKIMDEHLRFIGFKTLLVAPTDADTSLVARTNLANSKGADAYFSIHFDAMGNVWGSAEGHSIFVYPGSTTSKKLAECVAEFLKQGTVQKWRGIREQNFHVLRETKMPCILSENGFMDNPREARLMINTDFQKEVAKEHVQGICKYFGVPYKELKEVDEEVKEVTKGLFRIKTGTFPNARAFADAIDRIKSDFDMLIYEAADTISFNPNYRIYTGTFTTKEAAQEAEAKIKTKYGWTTYLIDETK